MGLLYVITVNACSARSSKPIEHRDPRTLPSRQRGSHCTHHASTPRATPCHALYPAWHGPKNENKSYKYNAEPASAVTNKL